jgi:hypothetical protein
MDSNSNLEKRPDELTHTVANRLGLPDSSVFVSGSGSYEQTLLVIKGVRDISAAIILSGGAVYGLVMFIHESFAHPQAALMLLPALGPAAAAAMAIIFKKRNGNKVDRNT